ncbi:metal ABC transporter permease [Schlegelella sp. S2-27]|uniref:Metal ABC transporter permease n=1 Tax=Caldimonas mangrovi TaxID=2944811 RepID=A0ABT0YPI4_9BURK|nr:metal ABC transporter permease [Caldimonas mangrovi]MCM5680646.1 metal ABC transporter permease [Caldimonas mangrovi]
MSEWHQALLGPFQEFSFMRRALVATAALALGSGPIGCLLVLRRMSLVGDAMAHAVLPGAAAGFLLAGLSLPAMSLGGLVAALAVALGAGFVTRSTAQREDASFAAFYLIALAAGVLMVSLKGSQVDLMHLLFGSVLAVDDAALLQIAAVASVTLLGLAAMYRPLVMETLDAGFLRSVGGPGATAHMLLLVLLVANLVSAFQALGTLMAVGLMMLPAASARFWVASLPAMAALATGFGVLGGIAGLLLSFHAELPSGPCIVLVCGGLYLLSVLGGAREGVLVRQWRRSLHLTG